MNHRFAISRLAAIVLAFAAAPASAVEFCVDSVAGIDDALAYFEEHDEDTVVRIAQGDYTIAPTIVNTGANLAIAGGYTDGTCQARSYDPALTVLRPRGEPDIAFSAENLEVGSLTFRNATFSATFIARGTLFSNGVLRMTRTRLEGPMSEGVVIVGEEIHVSESIVVNAGSDSAFTGRCAVNVEGPDDGDDVVAFQHSTIVGNSGTGLCIGDYFANDDQGFAVWIDNNILWGSSPVDLDISATSRYVARNNIVGGFLGEFAPADPGASGGTITADPLFVDAAGFDFRLQDASPAINSGRTSTYDGLPQLDIVGNTRWIGPAPDRGAYESSIDGTEVLTVTDDSDLGTPGTLRWALTQANANPNVSTIRFDLAGGCPRIILLAGELPEIVTPIVVDGFSQPGSHPNTGGLLAGGATDAVQCVWLGTVANQFGLRVPPGSAGRLNVSGIALGGFLNTAISIEGGTGSSLAGVDIFGVQPIGLFVGGTADATQIGGPDASQKNVFRGSSGWNIALNPGSAHAIVENNLIGLNPDGNSARDDNGVGIGISGSDNTIRSNAIAGTTSGIAIFDGDRNYIHHNTFGRKVGFQLCGLPPLPPCDLDLPNASHGVLIQGDANDNVLEGNRIANSGGAGIRATDGQRNFFIGNAIWNSAGLGVDLNGEGQDPFDNDGDAGAGTLANRGLNAPAFVEALGGRRNGRVLGVLSSTNGTYVAQAYASYDCANAHPQARFPIGFATVTITGAAPGESALGLVDVRVHAPSSLSLTGLAITAMVSQIDAGGYGNTSELSFCTMYVDDTIFEDGFD